MTAHSFLTKDSSINDVVYLVLLYEVAFWCLLRLFVALASRLWIVFVRLRIIWLAREHSSFDGGSEVGDEACVSSNVRGLSDACLRVHERLMRERKLDESTR